MPEDRDSITEALQLDMQQWYHDEEQKHIHSPSEKEPKPTIDIETTTVIPRGFLPDPIVEPFDRKSPGGCPPCCFPNLYSEISSIYFEFTASNECCGQSITDSDTWTVTSTFPPAPNKFIFVCQRFNIGGHLQCPTLAFYAGSTIGIGYVYGQGLAIDRFTSFPLAFDARIDIGYLIPWPFTGDYPPCSNIVVNPFANIGFFGGCPGGSPTPSVDGATYDFLTFPGNHAYNITQSCGTGNWSFDWTLDVS